MGKEELRWQINSVKNQIPQLMKKKKELEEKYELLLNFSYKCNAKAEAFSVSIDRRKSKLSMVEELVDRVKSAAQYRDKMGDMLTGYEFNKVYNSIGTLLQKVDAHKKQIDQELQDTEKEIQRLQYQLKQLQYQYDTYSEEDV